MIIYIIIKLMLSYWLVFKKEMNKSRKVRDDNGYNNSNNIFLFMVKKCNEYWDNI